MACSKHMHFYVSVHILKFLDRIHSDVTFCDSPGTECETITENNTAIWVATTYLNVTVNRLINTTQGIDSTLVFR
jgi:hypothetical protein